MFDKYKPTEYPAPIPSSLPTVSSIPLERPRPPMIPLSRSRSDGKADPNHDRDTIDLNWEFMLKSSTEGTDQKKDSVETDSKPTNRSILRTNHPKVRRRRTIRRLRSGNLNHFRSRRRITLLRRSRRNRHRHHLVPLMAALKIARIGKKVISFLENQRSTLSAPLNQ